MRKLRLWRGGVEPGDVIREGLGDVARLVLEAHLDLAFSIQRTTQGKISGEADVVRGSEIIGAPRQPSKTAVVCDLVGHNR